METMDWDNLQLDGHGNLVDVTQKAEPGPPPDMTWTRLDLWAMTGPIFGRYVSVSDCYGIEDNLVVVSDVFTDDAGAWVHLVTMERFRLWEKEPESTRSRTPTPARAVLAKRVWVMHEKPAER